MIGAWMNHYLQLLSLQRLWAIISNESHNVDGYCDDAKIIPPLVPWIPPIEVCVSSWWWHAIIWLILNDIMHSVSQQYWIISMDFNWERSLVIIRLSGLSHSYLILWAGNTIVLAIRFIYSGVVMSLIFTRIPQMTVTQFQYWQMDIKHKLKFNIKIQNWKLF